MKKFLPFFIFVVILGVARLVDARISNPALPVKGGENNKDYVTVCNDVDGHSLPAGTLVFWSSSTLATTSTDPCFGVSVSSNPGTNGTRVAGVVNPYAMASGGIGRIQVYGYCNNLTVEGAVVEGDVLIPALPDDHGQARSLTLLLSTNTLGIDYGAFAVAISSAVDEEAVHCVLLVN